MYILVYIIDNYFAPWISISVPVFSPVWEPVIRPPTKRRISQRCTNSVAPAKIIHSLTFNSFIQALHISLGSLLIYSLILVKDTFFTPWTIIIIIICSAEHKHISIGGLGSPSDTVTRALDQLCAILSIMPCSQVVLVFASFFWVFSIKFAHWHQILKLVANHKLLNEFWLSTSNVFKCL